MESKTETSAPLTRLQRVVRGKLAAPVRVLIYGVDKVGKSSFAAGAPNCVFLGSETGTSELDVARLPSPDVGCTEPGQAWVNTLETVSDLTTGEHDYKSLALDSLDWFEPLVWAYVCKQNGWRDIEEPGYGKGYNAALTEWRNLIGRLEHLREKRGMHIIMVAHSHVKAFNNPTGENYDRYTLKMNEKAAGPLKEWVDALLFAHQQYFVANKESKAFGGKQQRMAVGDGVRTLYTERRPAWDAGNRYGLPDELPLSWDDFYKAISETRERLPELKAAIAGLIEDLNAEDKTKAVAALARASEDVNKLRQLIDWCKNKASGG